MLYTHILILLLISYVTSQIASCQSGEMCNDNDFCTGTFTSPDVCENGECVPGPAACPFYTKKTVTNGNEETGELNISNDDKWLYIVWKSTDYFIPSSVYLYVAADPLPSDDVNTFPFQFSARSERMVQVRVNLELLEYPTEMDPIFLALRLENTAGAGSWMSGYFTPARNVHGGSYGFTSVCHCIGYSHVESLIDRKFEIETFSALTAGDVLQPQADCVTNSSSSLSFSITILFFVVILSIM